MAKSEKDEKFEKKEEKKSSALGVLAFIILLLAIAVLLYVFLGNGFGFGNGGGFGFGNNQNEPQIEDVFIEEKTESSEPEITEAVKEINYVYITVSENRYIYNNTFHSLEEILADLENISDEYVVKITDENASLQAYNDLTNALTEKSIPYTE